MLSGQTLSAWSRCGECCTCKYSFDCGVQHGWHWVTLDIDPISTLGRKGLRSFIVLWIWPKSEWTGRIGVKWYFYVCCTLRDKAVVGCWMEMLTVVWVSWWDIHHVGLRTGYFKPTQKIMNKLNVYTTAEGCKTKNLRDLEQKLILIMLLMQFMQCWHVHGSDDFYDTFMMLLITFFE